MKDENFSSKFETLIFEAVFLINEKLPFNKIQLSIITRECTFDSHWCWQLYRLSLEEFISTIFSKFC